MCNIVIYTDDTTLYSNCDQGSDLWQQLELASELESDLRYTVDRGKIFIEYFKNTFFRKQYLGAASARKRFIFNGNVT